MTFHLAPILALVSCAPHVTRGPTVHPVTFHTEGQTPADEPGLEIRDLPDEQVRLWVGDEGLAACRQALGEGAGTCSLQVLPCGTLVVDTASARLIIVPWSCRYGYSADPTWSVLTPEGSVRVPFSMVPQAYIPRPWADRP